MNVNLTFNLFQYAFATRARINDASERDGLLRVIRACDGIALALELCGQVLNNKRASPVAALAEDLCERVHKQKGPNGTRVLQASLDLSFDCLSESSKEAAILAAHFPPFSFDNDMFNWAAQFFMEKFGDVSDSDGSTSDSDNNIVCLDQLIGLSLVAQKQSHGGSSFQLHDVVRRFLKTKSDDNIFALSVQWAFVQVVEQAECMYSSSDPSFVSIFDGAKRRFALDSRINE